MTDLRSEAAALAQLADRQTANAADYDRMAETYPHRGDHYKAQAARCRLDAAWYSQKAAERLEWAEAGPESSAAMFARLAELFTQDKAA